MSEALMARGKYLELEMEARRLVLGIEESRSALREATAPFVAPHEMDTARIVYLSAQLIKGVEDLRQKNAEMARLEREYNL